MKRAFALASAGRPSHLIVTVAAILAIVVTGCVDRGPATLAIGTPAPAFRLPGIDGKSHALDEYARSPVLVVVFTCNHCPMAQLYEQRIQRLHADYRERGVAVVAINPDSPKAMPVKELAYTDVPDTLEGMIDRAAHRKFAFPYLYDGDTQSAAAAFKVVALPQAYVFDAQRRLQYVGRIDDNVRPEQVKSNHVRAAIEALLAQKPVRVAATSVEGCPVTKLGQTAAVDTEQTEIKDARVELQMIAPPELKVLRSNGTPNLMLVNFWATWCRPCIAEFPDLVTTHRMYRSRQLELVTVSIDVPASRDSVFRVLQEQRAANRNFMFGSDDTAGLQEAFDKALPASVPFTLLLAPNGDVLHQQHGEAEVPSMRRAILANLPDDPKYPGLQAYWSGR